MTPGTSPIAWRRAVAVAAGKLAGTASRALGKGGGTSFPGLVATRLDPNLVGDLAAQLACGSMVVSGTNGKTTTARMLAVIVSDAGFAPLRNRTGSNLMRGLASSLVQQSNSLGNLSPHDRSLGLFEVDEAAVPEVLRTLTPHIVLLLDLFRDQLDRYGEVATVARLWSASVAALPSSSLTVANADDPLVTQVAESAPVPPLFFGIASADQSRSQQEHASDVKACPRCAGAIEYRQVFLGHLGHYRCPACAFTRPSPRVFARDVRLRGASGSECTIVTPRGEATLHVPLPGLYNVYNAVGAAAAAHALGVAPGPMVAALARVTPAFGRMERLEIDGRQVILALAKNPAGLNEVLRTLLNDGHQLHLMVLLNDNTADGHDVSWIWDADVEMLAGCVGTVVFAGSRAEDMALRFKYAGIIGPDFPPEEITHDTAAGIRRAVELTPPGETLFIVPTYTAMLDVRDTLARHGYVKQFWEE